MYFTLHQRLCRSSTCMCCENNVCLDQQNLTPRRFIKSWYDMAKRCLTRHSVSSNLTRLCDLATHYISVNTPSLLGDTLDRGSALANNVRLATLDNSCSVDCQLVCCRTVHFETEHAEIITGLNNEKAEIQQEEPRSRDRGTRPRC
jgi:hypothetical protein